MRGQKVLVTYTDGNFTVRRVRGVLGEHSVYVVNLLEIEEMDDGGEWKKNDEVERLELHRRFVISVSYLQNQ